MSRRVTDSELRAIGAEPSEYGPDTMGDLVAELRRLRGLILEFDADERAGGCALLDEAWTIREEERDVSTTLSRIPEGTSRGGN